MKSTPNRAVIIIGAGASADFSIKAKNDERKEDLAKINLPTGEELITQMISFNNEIIELFLYEFLKSKLAFKGDNNLTSSLTKYILKDSSQEIKLSIWQTNQNNKGNNISAGFLLQELYNQKIISYTEYSIPYIESSSVSAEKILEELPQLKLYYNLSLLLQLYDPPSIDNFLSQLEQDKIDIKSVITDFSNTDLERKKLVNAGKELVAFYLLKAEDNKIFTNSNKIWYRWLRNSIMNCGNSQENISEYLQNNFTIISFNYDRSLDTYLKRRIGHQIYTTLKSKIIYPYGALYEHPDMPYGSLKTKLDKKNRETYEFVAKLFLDDDSILKTAAKGIKVISEREESLTKKQFALAKESLTKAKKIYFFGFGFLSENCDELGLSDLKSSVISSKIRRNDAPSLYYTNFDNSQKVNNSFNQCLFDKDQRIDATTSSRGVYDALDKDFDLII